MRKFDLSLRSSRSSYFATFRHQLTILSKTDALDEEKWLNMLGTFVKDWFRYESHFVHGRDSLVDILKESGLLSESDAVLSYVSPAYHLLEGFSFIQYPPSGDFQDRVPIRHHDYDHCFQSVQLLQWNSQVKFNVTVYRNLPTTRDSIMTS